MKPDHHPATPVTEADPRPQPPREPEAWECCQSGCEPCIYDLYWDALSRYEERLAAWERRQAAGGGKPDAQRQEEI
jgi:hypothetical protein